MINDSKEIYNVSSFYFFFFKKDVEFKKKRNVSQFPQNTKQHNCFMSIWL